MNLQPETARILLELQQTYGTLESRKKKETRDRYGEMMKIKRRQDTEKVKSAQTDLSEPAQWYGKKDKEVLDMESMVFREKGHFRSTDDWKLREGSKFSN